MKTYVTQTFLPPIEEYQKFLFRIWNTKILTNRGELLLELESKIQEKTQVKYCLGMNNGTIPLQIVIKLLGNGGEIITTPFSYVATTASIVWESCTPVFVDIEQEYLTIDPSKIEAAITSKTTCILATHVFGNVCNIEAIEIIAKKHNLHVIYDAAHCFGVNYHGRSIFNYGDVSTCSFHATKIFHTGEGGMVFTQNEALFKKIYFSHNFGHNGQEEFYGVGINGKLNELNAAMGLSVLPYFDFILTQRKKIVDLYFSELKNTDIMYIKLRKGVDWNFSYFPVIFNSESTLLNVIKSLNEVEIYPRRYFFPSLNKINYLNKQSCPISEDIASRILCLPLFAELSEEKVRKITSLIKSKLC